MTTESTATVTINNRTYQVETTDEGPRGANYLLRGPRGAVYGTIRNIKNPEVMFLVNANARGASSIMNIWLSDKGGRLRQVVAL